MATRKAIRAPGAFIEVIRPWSYCELDQRVAIVLA